MSGTSQSSDSFPSFDEIVDREQMRITQERTNSNLPKILNLPSVKARFTSASESEDDDPSPTYRHVKLRESRNSRNMDKPNVLKPLTKKQISKQKVGPGSTSPPNFAAMLRKSKAARLSKAKAAKEAIDEEEEPTDEQPGKSDEEDEKDTNTDDEDIKDEDNAADKARDDDTDGTDSPIFPIIRVPGGGIRRRDPVIGAPLPSIRVEIVHGRSLRARNATIRPTSYNEIELSRNAQVNHNGASPGGRS